MTVARATVRVDIAASSAIYVNDHRITDRSTKPWGGSSTVDSFECERGDVVRECLRRGHRIAVRKIDEDEFIAQRDAHA